MYLLISRILPDNGQAFNLKFYNNENKIYFIHGYLYSKHPKYAVYRAQKKRT